ncbi:MAG: hypothetical protein ACTSRZ_07860 [Promethearchaeota archaeon]
MPDGIIIFKWDNQLGPILISTYPENLILPRDFQTQLYNTYRYTGVKPGFGTLALRNFKILFYFTGLEDQFYDVDKYLVALLLRKDEKAAIYKPQIRDFAENIIPNLNDDTHISTIKQQRIKINKLNNLIRQKKAELQNLKVKVPDPEELQKIINNQEGLIKEKSKLVAITNSKIAQLEKEIEGFSQSDNFAEKKLEEIFEQIAQLKSEISEKETTAKIKDVEIKDIQAEMEHLQIKNAELAKKLEELQNILHKKNLQAMEERAKIEKELEQKIIEERDHAFDHIKELQEQLNEKKMQIYEKQKQLEQLTKAYEDLSKKFEEANSKMEEITKEIPILEQNYEELDEKMKQLEEFYKDKMHIAKIFEKLLEFLEREPMYKIFCILWQRGSIKISELKNKLSIPTITLKKYLQKYFDAEILKQISEEEISLM